MQTTFSVITGCLFVNGDDVGSLERSLSFTCRVFGFPGGEEFKWSPRQNTWMYRNLVDHNREDFFRAVIQTCSDHHTKVSVIVSDSDSRTPASCQTHQEFVTKMLIERVDWLARDARISAIIVADRPGGGRQQERAFLDNCLENILGGTGYVMPENIAMNAVSTDSHFIRLLQAADLMVSSVTAYIAGENIYSPPIFEMIRPLLATSMGRIGGVGVKLHPDYWYVNLYHWLLGDAHFIRNMGGWPLPSAARRYARDANTP